MIHTAALLLLPGATIAQDLTDFDPLFESNDLIEVTITAPMTTLMRERPDEEYRDATFDLHEPAGEIVGLDIGLRTRGNFRRRPEICEFAPLRVNFKKKQTDDTLFDKQDKLKMVTHCQNGSPNYQQTVISEYLAYRVFNLLTDASFRVRLLRVTYVDTDKENRDDVNFAFFIEHADRISKRLGAPPVEIRMITIPELRPEYANLISLYHYFLGNTDYSQIATGPGMDCCHNQDLFANEGEKYYSVPYDFDMTGFVNADHSQPNSRFKLRNVRERRYRGYCLNNEYIPGSVARFHEKRDAIYDLINANELLDNGTRKSLLRFIDSFYKSLDSPKKIEKNIADDCI